MDVFISKPGTVAVFTENANEGAIRYVSISGIGQEGPWSFTKVLISGAQLEQAVKSQFMQTLGNKIYAYHFGDDMGASTISGYTFFRLCDDQQTEDDQLKTGADEVFDYYDENKFSQAAIQTPVIITIGQRSMYGYLLHLMTRVVSEERYLSSFTMSFRVDPKKLPATGT